MQGGQAEVLKDVIEAKGDVGDCMDQHAADLSDACKAAREAKAKDKEAKAQVKRRPRELSQNG